jgi:hypothetical protein
MLRIQVEKEAKEGNVEKEERAANVEKEAEVEIEIEDNLLVFI